MNIVIVMKLVDDYAAGRATRAAVNTAVATMEVTKQTLMNKVNTALECIESVTCDPAGVVCLAMHQGDMLEFELGLNMLRKLVGRAEYLGADHE